MLAAVISMLLLVGTAVPAHADAPPPSDPTPFYHDHGFVMWWLNRQYSDEPTTYFEQEIPFRVCRDTVGKPFVIGFTFYSAATGRAKSFEVQSDWQGACVDTYQRFDVSGPVQVSWSLGEPAPSTTVDFHYFFAKTSWDIPHSYNQGDPVPSVNPTCTSVDPALTVTKCVGLGIKTDARGTQKQAVIHVEDQHGSSYDAPFYYSVCPCDVDPDPTPTPDPPQPWAVKLQLEQQTYPSDDWKPVDPGSSVIAGNPLRVRVIGSRPRNSDDATIAVHDTSDGRQLTRRPVESVDLAPGTDGGSASIPLDTTEEAWTPDGAPNSDPVDVVAVLQSKSQRIELSQKIQINPRPVVLVHGYQSNAATWNGFKQLLKTADPQLVGWAVGDGRVTGTMNTGSLDAPMAATNTIAQNAQEEATYIDGVRRSTGAEHVDVVAHSMGGLITREYIQNQMPAAPSDDHPVVHRLVQLGTPNMGSPLADMLMLPGVVGSRSPGMPATLQLTTYYAQGTFNKAVTDLKGVPISNLVGTHLPLGIFIGRYDDYGDGIVPAWSARWTLRHYTEQPGLMHTAMTGSATAVHDYVLPALQDGPDAGGSPSNALRRASSKIAAAAPPSDSASPAPSDSTSPSPSPSDSGSASPDPSDSPTPSGNPSDNPGTGTGTGTGTGSGTGTGTGSGGGEQADDENTGDAFDVRLVRVAAGATAQVPVTVPSGMRWGAVTSAGVQLHIPGDPDAQDRDLGPARTAWAGVPTDHTATLEVANPTATAIDVPLSFVIVGGTVRFSASTPTGATVAPSSATTIRADLTDKNGAPLDGTITATAVDIASKQTVSLYDDGKHDDGAAGDGHFAGDGAVLPAGQHPLVIRAHTAQGDRLIGSVVTGAGKTSTRPLLTSAGPIGDATVGTAFADPVRATLTRDGVPSPGAAVRFTAAGATFPSGNTATVTTDVNGRATSPTLTAGTKAGDVRVTIASEGVDPVSATGTATAGSAATIIATGGSAQSAVTGKPFAAPLTAQVSDSYGNPVPGASVLFSATADRAAGAGSVTFSGAPTATVRTDQQGRAVSPTPTGVTPGVAIITATSGAATAAAYPLTVSSPATTPRADLAIGLTAPTSVQHGSTAAVRLTIRNNGPATALGSRAALVLPSGWTLGTPTSAVSQYGRLLITRPVDLRSGAATTVDLLLTAAARPGQSLIGAGTASAVIDPNWRDNTISRLITSK